MKLLSLETSTEACSAALFIDGVFHERHVIAPQQHAKLILGFVEELCCGSNIQVADLDAIAFGQGPGSFTGLRIAAGVAQGLAFPHDIPLIPISTLAAVALEAIEIYPADRVIVALDARMGEVYSACFAIASEIIILSPPMVCAPEKITLPDQQHYLAAGSGFIAYPHLLQNYDHLHRLESVIYPSAKSIARLAIIELEKGKDHFTSFALPAYIRNQVVQERKSISSEGKVDG